jgi:hypothetical protein
MARDALNAELLRQREAELRRSAERHVEAQPPGVERRRALSLRGVGRLYLALIARVARNPDLA